MVHNLWGPRGREQIHAAGCSHITRNIPHDWRTYIFMSIDTSLTSHNSHNGNGKTPVATHTVYLALGSNLGDRRGNLAAALQRLREVMEIVTVSSVYDTEPVGYTEQPRFLNIVLSV